MSEYADEMLSRLRMMASGDGRWWDLSDNDRTAINWAIGAAEFERMVYTPDAIAEACAKVVEVAGNGLGNPGLAVEDYEHSPRFFARKELYEVARIIRAGAWREFLKAVE